MSPLDRHVKAALWTSGGKDSLALVHLLRHELHRLTVYTLDTGDQLPEQREAVAHIEALCPNFVRITSEVRDWVRRNGLPSDLVPFSSHPIGRILGQERVAIVPRYDCCFVNIMEPLLSRTRADGCTLIIRGSKRCDMPRLPWASGQRDEATGLELWLPLEDWSDSDVHQYLHVAGIPVPRFYDEGLSSVPDCAHCTAWWNDGRAAYLKAHYPEIWADYSEGLALILHELGAAMHGLQTELGGKIGRL